MVVYDSIPEEVERKTTITDRHNILRYLQSSGEARSARQIAKAVGLPTKDTCVQVRQAITELVTFDSEPIVATGKGFLLADTTSQLDHYDRVLDQRIQGIMRRREALRSARRKIAMREEGYA